MPGQQLPLDFNRDVRTEYDRGQQLAILRHAHLPAVTVTEAKTVRKVKPRDMIAVLKVLDDHGRDCWPSLPTIAREARMGLNPIRRALVALQSLSLLCIEKRPKRGGGFTNRYVIVWSELALRCQGDVLARLRPRPPAPEERPPAPEERPPAPEERPPAPRGAGKRPRSAPLSAQGSALIDDDVDDAELRFLQEKGNVFSGLFPCRSEAIRMRVLRIGRLWYRGTLPPDVCEDVLRVLRELKRAGHIQRPSSLLHMLFSARGYDLDRLIVPVPASLLTPPARPAAASQEG